MKSICSERTVEVLDAIRESFEPGSLARIELLDEFVARIRSREGRIYLASLRRDGKVRIEEIEEAC